MKHDETPRIPCHTEHMIMQTSGIKRELDTTGVELPKKKRPKESRHSHYVGVRWNDECKKWYASLHANGKHHYCGLYEHEGDAARAVNAKCGELDIPHKNKGLGIIEIRKKNKKARSSRKSAYKGIYWVEKSQSWQVKIKYQKKLHSGGTFQDEYLAAQAANLLCVKLNIPQKNAAIGVNDILEKMKDGKIPPRRPRPRRKFKNKNSNGWSTRNPHAITTVKREQGSSPVIPIVPLFPSEHAPSSFTTLAQMSAQEVAEWLRDLRFLDKYIDQFLLCEVSGPELIDIDEVILDDFGMPKIFQKRLLRCIEQLAMNGFHRHFPSKKESLIRKLGRLKPRLSQKHLPMLGDEELQDPAATSPPLDHVPPIIAVTPVKLEEVPVVSVANHAPPALEIPQIKQEKIDQQVFNTILESTQKGDPAHPHFEPERIIERTEKGLKVRWKGFGPKDDTEEPVEKFEGYQVYKDFLEREAEEEKKGKRKRGRPKKKTDSRTSRLDILSIMKSNVNVGS